MIKVQTMLYARQWELQPALRYVAEWTTTSRLAGQRAAWQRLAENAIEPNPFYEPDYLLASALHIESGEIRCIAVYRDGARDSDLIGLFPLSRARLALGLPLPALEFYRNDFICQTTPLIDNADPVGVWNCFFAALERTSDAPRKVLASLMLTSRGAFAALEEAQQTAGRAMARVESFSRAAVDFKGSFASYSAQYSAQRQKSTRRKLRKLASMGHVEMHAVTEAADKPAALAEFLRIEASGWKGQEKTAMAQSPGSQALAEAVFLTDTAEFDVLSLDGKAIAVMASILSSGVLYTIKTAYDESYSGVSPGTILDQHQLQRVLDQPDRYSRIDSCAVSGNAVEAIWREREEIASLVIATTPALTQTRVEASAALLRQIGKLKSWVKEQIA